jgi:predicted DNA-binding transcriptional regulator AlpA
LRNGAANTASSKRKRFFMSDVFENARVVDEPTAVRLVGVSPRTWDRMRSRGETPPITRISERRIGYRLSDIKTWLDSRRVDPSAA